jgi:hypothetical protein
MFEESGGKESVKGSTVEPDAAADRVSVFKALLELGIPITKLENPKFVTLIEKPHQSLGEGEWRSRGAANCARGRLEKCESCNCRAESEHYI